MKKIACVLFFLPALAWGQGRIVEEIVVVVNGEAITKSEYQEMENQAYQSLSAKLNGDALKKAFDDAKAKLLDTMIEDKLLLQEAKSKNYDVENEVDEILARLKKENNIKTDDGLTQALAAEGFTLESWRNVARERLIRQRLISQEVQSKVEVPLEEIRNYYSSHPEEFEIKAKIRLSEIFFSAEKRGGDEAAKLAAETLARVTTGGEDFATVAKSVSEGPSKDQGGDLGWIAESDLAADLKDAITGLTAGAVTAVLPHEKGSRIVKVVERQGVSQAKFENVKDTIEQKLRAQKSDQKIQDYIEQLKKDSYIFKPGEKK